MKSSYTVDEVRKMLRDDPGAVSKELRDATARALETQLFPVALEREARQHPELSVGEVAKRAAISARAAVYQVEPELGRPAPSAATIRRRAELLAEAKRLEDAMAGVAQYHISKGMDPRDAESRAVGSPLYGDYRRVKDALQGLT